MTTSPSLIVLLYKAVPSRKLGGREDYVPVGEFLVPRDVEIQFEGGLSHPIKTTHVDVGYVRGMVSVRDGNPTLTVVELTSIRRDYPINGHFAQRVPYEYICFRVTAMCSLTRSKDRHYVVVPPPRESDLEADFLRQILERAEDKPIPVRRPPRPVLQDNDDRWYHIQVDEPLRLLFEKRSRKRTLVSDEFLNSVWQAYMNAKERGEKTTQAVADWHAFNYGRAASTPTINRWIRQAKDRFGEEATGATHE